VKASPGTKRKRSAQDHVDITGDSASHIPSNRDAEDVLFEEMGNTEDPEELELADAQAGNDLEASTQPEKATSEQITHDENLVKLLKDVAVAQMIVRGVAITSGEATEALKIIPKVCVHMS
jgi:hypothetical protein